MVMAGAGGDVDVDLDVVDGGAGGLDIWATSCREEDEAPALTLVRPIVLSLSIDDTRFVRDRDNNWSFPALGQRY